MCRMSIWSLEMTQAFDISDVTLVDDQYSSGVLGGGAQGQEDLAELVQVRVPGQEGNLEGF